MFLPYPTNHYHENLLRRYHIVLVDRCVSDNLPSTDTKYILQLSFFKIFLFFQCFFPLKNLTIALSFELNERVSFSSWDIFLTINLDGLIKSILVEIFLPIESCAGVNEVVV